MPRDISGNYTLPAGNPVVDNTTIATAWGNDTMNDIAAQLNNVLTRDGVLGATGPQKFASGSVAAPGIAWTAESSSGFFRVSANIMGVSIAGTEVARWAASLFAVTGAITATGNVTLSAGNLIVSAGTASVAGAFSSSTQGNFQGGQLSAIGASATPTQTGGIMVQSASGAGNAAFMSFHRPGAFAAFFGIDTDNVWKVGGWSMGAVAYPILHSNNFNTYAPTLTGTGASGTWGINITGNANTVDGFDTAQAATASTIAVRDGSGHLYAVNLNMSSANNDGTTPNQIMFTAGGSDGYLRKGSISAVSAVLTPSWTNVSGRPTDLGSFTNGPGYITAASPGLTGNPTAPTQSVGDNDTSIATTAFANAAHPGYTGYVNQTASRAFDTTYTNTSGRPMFVIVTGNSSQVNAILQIVVAGTTVGQQGAVNQTNVVNGVQFLVPAGATYRVNQSTGTSSLTSWYEI